MDDPLHPKHHTTNVNPITEQIPHMYPILLFTVGIRFLTEPSSK